MQQVVKRLTEFGAQKVQASRIRVAPSSPIGKHRTGFIYIHLARSQRALRHGWSRLPSGAMHGELL
jgi:hypothetical protein